MEIFMSYTLQVRAFFFNRKTDYLPYYKNFTLTLPDDALAKDILLGIQAQNDMFSFPQLNLVFKINDFIVEEDTPLVNIVKKLGLELQIDPANSYRANNGLIINNDDFMKSFELLAPYASDDDRAYYKTLYALHYASETENYNHSYIGDAVLVLAYKMISEGNAHKDAILKAIGSVESGLLDCEYENNLFNPQDHTETITALKQMLKNDDEDYPSLIDMIKEHFFAKEEISTPKEEVLRKNIHIDNLEEKRIAHYVGNSDNPTASKLIETSGIPTVTFSRTYKLSGLTLLEDNKTLALQKAGRTLLDAYDSGAQVLVVNDNDTYDMMKDNFSAIENVIGRKMIDLELITAEDFILQLEKSVA